MRSSTLHTPDVGRRRAAALGAGAAVILVGLGLRATDLPGADVGGDVLYAVLVYLLVVAVRPRWSRRGAAGLALGLCWAVELLQLTGLPAAAAQVWWPVRYVLGSTFTWVDLVAYTAGVLLAAGLDAVAGLRSAPA